MCIDFLFQCLLIAVCPGFLVTIFGGTDGDVLMFKKLEIEVGICTMDDNVQVWVQVDEDDLPDQLTNDQKTCLATFFQYLFKLAFCNIVTPENGLKITKHVGSRDSV